MKQYFSSNRTRTRSALSYIVALGLWLKLLVPALCVEWPWSVAPSSLVWPVTESFCLCEEPSLVNDSAQIADLGVILSTSMVLMRDVGQQNQYLELPVLFDTLDRPVELLTQRLREEALNGDIKLLREHDSQARVDVVLS